MRKKGATVRLTAQAHSLLSEKVDDYHLVGHKISMKDIASEAIFMLIRGEDRDKEQFEHLKAEKEKAKRAREFFALYALLLGAAGVVLGFIMSALVV